MNAKKLLALLLTVVMLASALPLGVFAADEVAVIADASSSSESTAYESQDYYWNMDFNTATPSTTATTVFTAGRKDPAASPYGFAVTDNLTKAYVREKVKGDNYMHVAYDIHTGSSWRGAQIAVGKSGMSASVFNTISYEMDFRWQGYAYTTEEHSYTKGSFPILQIRRYENNPTNFLLAKEDENGNLNLYLKELNEANIVANLKKGAETFTNIKVVYYDITQTFSLYIDGDIIADGLPISADTDYRSDSFVTSVFDQADMLNTSREQNPAKNAYITFQVMRLDYGAKACACGDNTRVIQPIQFDIDNLKVKNYDIYDGITPYIENSFDADFVGITDTVTGKAYSYVSPASISKGTYNGNSYVNVEPGGRFNVLDYYQFVQDGNFVVEFDARVTSAGDNRFIVMHTGADTRNWLTVDAEGYIHLSGAKTKAKVIAHKDAEGNLINQDKWTHIALAVAVDKGGSHVGKPSNFLQTAANDSLRFQLALFVDGELVAVHGDVTRAEFLQSGGNNFKLLDDRTVTKKAVTEEPSSTTLAAYTKLDYVRTIGTDNKAYYYHDPATGDIYQLQYDASGNFVPGTVSSGAGTGSIWLDVTGTTAHYDVIGFFNNNNTSTAPAANISGAIDNLKIYSGVIPLNWASTLSSNKGLISEINFVKLTTTPNENRRGCVMNNYKGGDTGVALVGSWNEGRVTYNDGYASYNVSANSEIYFDIFTQNAGGKIFSLETTVRKFVPSANISFIKLRRQKAGGGIVNQELLSVSTDGSLYYYADSEKFFLCNAEGELYKVSGEEWITPEVIIDETGSQGLVTYLVNGELAYCIPEGAAAGYVPYMAACVQGVISAATYNVRNAIDQRARFFHTGSAAYFNTDIKNVKAEYTTLPDEVQQAKGYYDVEANDFAGTLYSAKMSFKGFNKTYDVNLFTPIRRLSSTAPAYEFETLFAEASTGYLYFEHLDGSKCYLVDSHRERYSISGSTAVTPQVIFDERGENILVTFLVDGEVAYYDNGEGLVSASNLYIGGSVVHALSAGQSQIIRFFQIPTGEDSSFANVSTVKLETVTSVPEAEEITWADSARIDFSKYTSLDELGEQFEWTDGVTLENGLLKIPAGGSFKWIDYNGTFISFCDYETRAVNDQYLNGYTIEFIGNVNVPSKRGLLQLDRFNLVDGELVSTLPSNNNSTSDNFIWVNKNSASVPTFHLTGGTNQYYPLNPVGSDKYNNISITLANTRNEGNVFVDGYLLGKGAMTNFNNAAYSSGKIAKIIITGEAEIKELRIHRDLEREFASESGEIFKLDVNNLELKYDGDTLRWANLGIMAGGILTNKTITTQTTYTNAETGESFKYFKIQPTTALTSHNFSTIWLNGQLEDKVTVFEYDFRFASDGVSNTDVEMCSIRRAEDNSTEGLFDNLFYITPNANYKVVNGYILCDEDGTPIVASAENWNKFAIIYDADAGLVSYVLDGKIPYYADGDTLKLAQNIQLPTPRHYRMDAAEIELRILSMFKTSAHRLDFAKLNVYTVDTTANAEYIGVQTATDSNDIRVVAGLDMLYYGAAGFDVEAFDANGNRISESVKTYATNEVYSSIVETVGGEERTVYPEDYGYRYFLTANITGIPTDEAVKINVTPFTVTNGVKYSAATFVVDVDFNKSNANEISTTKSQSVKPVGDNTSGNFSITDVVAYTNDGALEFNGLDAKFGFAANLEGGVVSVNLTNAFGEAAEKTILDVYVDGELVEEGLELPFGHHTLVLAEGLTGEHEFVLVKRTGGDFICINSMNICGEFTSEPPALAKKNAVEVVVEAPASGADYGNVRVYVPTSDESGNYYIKYNFEFLNFGLDPRTTDADLTNDPTYSSGGGNTKWNCHMYRIIASDLCEKVGNTYTRKFGLLQTGEISVAMKEAVNGSAATDFSGGFHGDENFLSLKFLLDGVELDTTKSGTYTGVTTVEFIQDTIINRCNEIDTPILLHAQHFLVDTNGLRIDRHLEVLADNFSPHHSNGYTMMATVYRIGAGTTKLDQSLVNDAEKVAAAAETFNIKTLNVLNANGELADDTSTFDMREKAYVYRTGNEGSTACAADSSAVNRYAENTGDKGVYARVGFVIDDASMQPKTVRVDVRLAHGDNKWYAAVGSYQTEKNGDIVPKGEKWNLSTYYFVDYNLANIAATN